MSFIEPLFLIGLIAALLPILIHLINRKKAVRRVFGPMRFLLQSQKRKAPGFKARQFVLMSIRVVLVALLAMALAKPFFLSDSGLTASERLPSATVIVVDNSFSMEARWSEARDALEKELSSLRTWDQVVVITTNPTVPIQKEKKIEESNKLSNNHDVVRDYAETILVSKEKGNVAAAIERASKILTASELPNHRIAVISDFSMGGFPTHVKPNQPITDPVDEYRIRPKTTENIALVSVTYEQSGDARDNLWLIRATLKNFGTVPRSEQIELEIDGKSVAGAQISIPPNGIATHVFRHVIEGKERVRGRVRVSEADQISFDNVSHFVILLRKKINVLVVNGEPNSISHRDEAFFLERALNPMGSINGTESNINVSVTTREGLETRMLNDYDVVSLANVSRVSPATGKRLLTFVEDGGGLFIAMGDQVDPTAYNQHLEALLPKPLRGLKRLANRADPDAPVKITRIATMKTSHPIFRVFELPGGTSIRDTEVFSYMLLEPSPPGLSDTIMSYKDNAPALLERRVGRGSVIMLTTSVDDEWTDFPFRTSFLPMMRRISQHLAKRVNSFDKKAIHIGDEVELEIGSLVRERLIIKTPSDARIVLVPMDGKVSFGAQEAGVYEFWADDEDDKNRLDALSFAANFDPEESNLEPIDEAILSQWISAEKSDEKSGVKTNERRVNLWPWLLFIVTMMLLLETIVSTRQSVLVKLWNSILNRS